MSNTQNTRLAQSDIERNSVRSSPHRSENSNRWSTNSNLGFTRGFMGTQTWPRVHQGSQQHQNSVMAVMSNSQSVLNQTIHEESFNAQNQVYLWGTNVELKDIKHRLRNFIENYQLITTETQIQKYYINQLIQIKETEIYILNVDGQHLFEYDRDLYQKLINYPAEIIMTFDVVVNEIYKEYFNIQNDVLIVQQQQQQQQSDIPQLILVRILNLQNVNRVRDLNPSDINHLLCVKGIVIRCSDIYPEMKAANFRCVLCGHKEIQIVERARIQEPNDCIRCRSKQSFEIIHNLCTFTNKQYIKLQETPETVTEGETPQTVTLVVYDDLVDTIRPGDRVEVVGIYRAQGIRLSQYQRILKSVYKTYIDVISFTLIQKQKFIFQEEEFSDDPFTFSDQLKRDLLNLSQRTDIYDKLVEALAPGIWENEDVKKGILCQIFGGSSKEINIGGKGRFRSEINVLLVGDPSTAKSQLLQYVHKIAPRGIYTSGKSTSAVGLTAYVTTDIETKEIILESGALVLSDKGICCIDEFDKMDENSRGILHEAMEQQTISIAKRGIVCQLNARTAILASANPVESKYNPRRSVVENIKLPPTLLSRFDLIYLMLDKVNENNDRKLANHILNMYSNELNNNNSQQVKPLIPRDILTKYISFARKYINPQLTEVASDELVKCYVNMRRMGTSRNIITATPRQLESLIRISEALAKMRYSTDVLKDDVQEALRLIKVATQSAATDPTTGCIDIDLISTGITAGSRNKINTILELIKQIQKQDEERARKGFKFTFLYDELKKRFDFNEETSVEPFSENEYREALKLLEEENIITLYGARKNPLIKFVKA